MEIEVSLLNAKLTVLQKQLIAVEDAERKSSEQETPEFNGIE